MSTDYIYKRGEKFIYRRRVPKYVSNLDHRKEIKLALKTDNYQEAVVRANIYNEQIETFWRALLQSGKSKGSNEKYKTAVQLARAYGFTYKTADQIASSTLNEIVDRLSIDINSQQKADALLGGVQESHLKLSDCTELYWELVHDRLSDKTAFKVTKWKNPRKAAIENFIAVVGNKHLHEIDRKDILDFRGWWNKRIKNGLSADSANKQLRYVKDILQTVSNDNEIDIDFEPLFLRTRFQYKVKSRPPFEVSFVQNTLLRKLDGLNDRDRMVIMALADTGARISEIFGLKSEDIKLNDEVPFIWIRPREGYALKTSSSERKIPLVGSSLYAFTQCPDGFNHVGNPDTFSNMANNYLKNNNLRPTPQHKVYSLRHTFKDRLRDIEAPEEIIDDLMGHKKNGPKYGRGHRLDTKLKWLEKIAFTV
ncbi:site-specific tyrosine recombinase XerC [Kordia sp. SMS9]|uniref:DUF6538 domain-containing protein n=1 Tax=Kordia sp. SMS9 TaxID=2282170 RepID=UPI000E0DBC22|nr:DUF6538 domain-containing protein [Kordia sp. SMS9]AXG69598.1 site-specific tyrosine recombinase XerC [Kordia sp. SMS9]